ncbi:MAG: 4-hydroxy-3-methylbut-2-enyl diphosphate reductase [Bacteroidetes bacterium]|nr:4-hydroxy-3-methylbut-2-enyl diphosphate reductase [Bacteroidota bacterium]
MGKRILLASPRGFCMGVERAIKMLEDTISRESGTIYVRKEIVHNDNLVEHFKSLGVVIVDEVDDVPEGCVVVFSAHGVAPSVRENAKIRNLKIVDTTCPLVTKVHNEAIRFKEQGYTIILIGEAGHKEVIGVMGEAPDNIHVIQNKEDVDNLTGIDSSRVAWLSQTTLNVDETMKIVEELREKYPLIQGPSKSDICYATRNRQLAVKNVANECDLFIVVGSKASSNTKRLAEVASESRTTKVVRIDGPEELISVDFSSVQTVGVSSGVSVANEQLMRIIEHLKKTGYTCMEERVAVKENDAAF